VLCNSAWYCCLDRTQGYLAPAMVNYLSLLGWNDGTEKEIYSVDELTQAFALDRITKSAAVFDKVKLSWMNGQHLRWGHVLCCHSCRPALEL
jgi:glutamyl/glutaminyl-tRNA synthetase